MSSCEPPIKGQPAWHATFQLCPGTTLQLCRNTPNVDNLSYVKLNIETQTPALEAPTPVNLSALGNYDHLRHAYGATTLASALGNRQPSANGLDIARYKGKHVAELAY